MNAAPIQLHLDDAGSTSTATHGATSTILFSAIGALVIIAALFILQRRTELFSRNEQDAAFRLLARRLDLRAPQRALLRSIAQRTSTPPASLLICESAFNRAIEAFGKLSSADRARIIDIQRRIFADA